MIDISAEEYYNDILFLLHNDTVTLSDKYKKIRSLFYRLCKQLTNDNKTQYSNFFSRLTAVCSLYLENDPHLAKELQGLRIRLKKLDSPDYVPSASDVKTDLYLLARAVNHLMNTPLPKELSFLSNNNVSEIIPFDYTELGADFKKMRIKIGRAHV